jgi:hypothetical protein
MNQQRSEIMERARARRRRQAETKSARKASRKRRSPSTDSEVSLTEKAMDFAQGAVAHVGELVKTAADKVTGASDEGPGTDARGTSKAGKRRLSLL